MQKHWPCTASRLSPLVACLASARRRRVQPCSSQLDDLQEAEKGLCTLIAEWSNAGPEGFQADAAIDVVSMKQVLDAKLTSIPKRLRTVSLLASLALISPKSPTPFSGVAKCKVKADLEPPAATPHNARSDPLKHRATIRSPEADPGNDHGTSNGIYTESNSGERASRVIAASLRMSASKRYVLASGKRDVPMKYAAMIAKIVGYIRECGVQSSCRTH